MTSLDPAPYAWTAPESFEVTEETTFTHYASPYNPGDVGLAPVAQNKLDSEIEIDKQQGNIKDAYWKAFTQGVVSSLPGVGPAIAAHFRTGGELRYPFKLEDRELNRKFNPETGNIMRLDENKKSADVEEDKQGGYDWSLVLPANWIKTVNEYLAAKEAEKEGGGLPVTMAEDLKAAGGNVAKKAEDTAKAGKNIVDALAGKDGTPFDLLKWLQTDSGIMIAGVAGFVLILVLIK